MEEFIKCEKALHHKLKDYKFTTKCEFCGKTVKEIYTPIVPEITQAEIDSIPVPKPDIIEKKKPFWRFCKDEKEKIHKIMETDKEIIIYKEAKKLNLPSFGFDGYILYENITNSGDLKLIQIANFKEIYRKMKGKSFYLWKKTGTINGKPYFLVKGNIAISGQIKATSELINQDMKDGIKYYEDGVDMVYSPEVFDTMLDYVSFANLKVKKGVGNIGEFIRENWLFILVAIIIVVIIFATPQGRQFIQNFLNDLTPKGK